MHVNMQGFRVVNRVRGNSGTAGTAAHAAHPIGVGGHDESVELHPPSVAAWPSVELRGPLTGGARNQVVVADRGSERLVVRHSGRPVPALDWELNLLEFLGGHGIEVPRLVSSDDGRRHVDGVLIYRWLAGERDERQGVSLAP